MHSAFLCSSYFSRRVLHFCLDWPWTMNLQSMPPMLLESHVCATTAGLIVKMESSKVFAQVGLKL
jgi:hypothetical protein